VTSQVALSCERVHPPRKYTSTIHNGDYQEPPPIYHIRLYKSSAIQKCTYYCQAKPRKNIKAIKIDKQKVLFIEAAPSKAVIDTVIVFRVFLLA